MKKIKSKFKILIIIMLLFGVTGCQTTLVDEDNKAVQNPETGQSLTENILCQPTEEKTRELYEENGVDLDKLPECTEFTPASTEYDGLWTGIFVKPLAFLILTLGKYIGSFALSIIIITIIIRLILYPFTRKMALQSEMMQKATPELERIRKKYEGKTDQESMLRQNQEMMMIYKKYNFNPLTSCLVSFIQFPLLLAFLEAINRVPAIFEENFLGIQLGTTPMIGFSTSTFYVYIILGLDFDSFAPKGGTTYIQQAQQIVNMAQSEMSWNGWKAFESNQNRHALATALQDNASEAFRDMWYTYHRRGLDEMAANPDRGRMTIIEALPALREVRSARPTSVLLQMFSDAKLDEIVAIYSKATTQERQDGYKMLFEIYPTQSTRLEALQKPVR